MADLEMNILKPIHGINDMVDSFSWRDIRVVVPDRRTKKAASILTDSYGVVKAGEMLALMGPSGSGKTTLLNALARRTAAAGAKTSGDTFVNGQLLGLDATRQLSSYVEQEDALIGSLTVEETMKFAAGLALPNTSAKEKKQRMDGLIASFGLRDHRDTIVGTPIRKGLSGGQKKRLSVASRLITDPRILFLDEPTSGLDSMLSFEVMSYIRQIAKQNNLIVIASIHQPSTATFKLFDKLCLLSRGETCYFGPLKSAPVYFESLGLTLPGEINPAEFYLDVINTDLAIEGDETCSRVERIKHGWQMHEQCKTLRGDVESLCTNAGHAAHNGLLNLSGLKPRAGTTWKVPMVLIHRSWIKAYRDVVAYGIRIFMYLGLALLMGTVFLRFGDEQRYIQPYINAIFFGGAFMSFMAVAYVPAFLEDRSTFVVERANGLVGPLAFVVSNFLIGLPFLFLIAILFSIVEYFMTGFRLSASAFWTFTAWLFLDLLAAESLVVLVSSTFPIFVVALAITAFANGLWMCVDGFLVPMSILNPFWKYVFHYIDYQAYVFQGMMVNEFKDRTYKCDRIGNRFACQFPSSLNVEGKIDGAAVLSAYKIELGLEGEWFGIMIAIIFVYRVLGYVALRVRQH